MIYLILAVVCSGSISLILKIQSAKSPNRFTVLFVNYVVAFAFGAAFIGSSISKIVQPDNRALILLILATGLIYITDILLMQTNIRLNGATVTASMSHMGMIITVLMSIFLFREEPGGYQIAGMVVSLIALFVIAQPSAKSGDAAKRWVLIPMVICYGVGDAFSKVFEVYFDHALENVYVSMTFGVAMICSCILMLIKGERINRYDVICGIGFGIVNYLSTDFLIRSLYTVPSYMAYIIFGFGVILFVNLVNVLLMHERLNKNDYMGMALAIGAIVLLNI